MHNDAYGTNADPGRGPWGRAPKVNLRWYGVEECATVVFDTAQHLLGLCINSFGPVLRLIDPTEIAPASVPKASLANGLVYVYTKPAGTPVDAWYLTASDLRTGLTAFSQLTGTGPGYNNHYASIYLGPDGSAYIPTLTGMVRVHDTN